jgi:hypothetical protein
VDLRWEQVEFRTASLHVRRVKQGTPSTHPIVGDELRALRRLKREQEPKNPFVFTSERGSPFTTAGFARMVERTGKEAKLAFKAHPHMLRHACGYALANKGHDTRALQASPPRAEQPSVLLVSHTTTTMSHALIRSSPHCARIQQRLNFFPEPQGQGSFLPTLMCRCVF